MPQRKSKTTPTSNEADCSGNPAPASILRVGPAGWSYPDWAGYVYPSRRAKDSTRRPISRNSLTPSRSTLRFTSRCVRTTRPHGSTSWRRIRALSQRQALATVSRTTSDPRRLVPLRQMNALFARASMCFARRRGSARSCCNSLFRFIALRNPLRTFRRY